jgi:hypothetical protein
MLLPIQIESWRLWFEQDYYERDRLKGAEVIFGERYHLIVIHCSSKLSVFEYGYSLYFMAILGCSSIYSSIFQRIFFVLFSYSTAHTTEQHLFCMLVSFLENGAIWVPEFSIRGAVSSDRRSEVVCLYWYCIMYTGTIECGVSESVGPTKEEWGESAHCWMGMQVNFILKFIFCDIFLPWYTLL